MMKKLLYILTTALLLSACEMEMSDNGNLDGLWQMTEMQIDNQAPVDMRTTGTVMGVQFNLMYIHNSTGGIQTYSRFSNEGGYLRLYDFREKKHDVSDFPIEDPTLLNVYGIFSLDERFKIETLTSSNMILKSDRSLLKFRKY